MSIGSYPFLLPKYQEFPGTTGPVTPPVLFGDQRFLQETIYLPVLGIYVRKIYPSLMFWNSRTGVLKLSFPEVKEKQGRGWETGGGWKEV